MGEEHLSGLCESSSSFQWPMDLSPFLCSTTDHVGEFGTLSCWSQISLLLEGSVERTVESPHALVLQEDWSPGMLLQQDPWEEESNPPDHDARPPLVVEQQRRLNSGDDEPRGSPTVAEDQIDVDFTRFVGGDLLLDHHVTDADKKRRSDERGRSSRSKKIGDEQKKKKKKPRIEMPSRVWPTFHTKREKLQDRINALQQLVSPFGRSDTASVLFETIEYIKYLHNQVNILVNSTRPQGEQNADEVPKQDLESQGLRMVPISTLFQSPESLSPVAGLQRLEDLMREIA